MFLSGLRRREIGRRAGAGCILGFALLATACSPATSPPAESPNMTRPEVESQQLEAFTEDAAGTPHGFTATEPGTHLRYGETASVLTESREGNISYFKVRVDAPRLADNIRPTGSSEDFTLPESASTICFPVSLTYLGAADTSAPTSLPDLAPATADGSRANEVPNSAAASCPYSQVPAIPKVGQTYRTALVSFTEPAHAASDPHGAQFHFHVPSFNRLDRAEAISWG